MLKNTFTLRDFATAVLLLAGLGLLTTAAKGTPTADSEAASEEVLSVWIVGDQTVAPNEECAWQAMASGGSGDYSYDWWGALNGDEFTVYGSLAASSYLWVEVTDNSTMAADTATYLIDVHESYSCTW